MFGREQQIERLKTTEFDILVIGGGATGCGIALEAASRGLKVGLVEKNDFSSGTSSRSTKLVHGGVRYLEKAILNFDRTQFNLVRDALKERFILLKIAPHLVWSLPILTPIYQTMQIPYYLTGLKLYDRLAGKYSLHSSYFINSKQALKRFSMLKKERLKGGVIYYDGQFDDARMNIALVLTASKFGATIVNYVEVMEFIKTKGKIRGVIVLDHISGEKFNVLSKVVINATGPFVDKIRFLDNKNLNPILTVSSGAHIVVEKKFSAPKTGLLIPKTDDGRVLFILPWLNHTLIGTTENEAEVKDNPKPTEAEIDYILKEVNKYFSLKINRSHVLSQWSGLRPLIHNPQEKDSANLVRDHIISISESGLMTIAGGKWTTYRKMALDLVNEALNRFNLRAKKSITESLILVGGENYNARLLLKLRDKLKLKSNILSHLIHSYGDRALGFEKLVKEGYGVELTPQYPFIEAEVIWAVKYEQARFATDVLARRLRLAFIDKKAAFLVLPRVVEILGKMFLWDKARKNLEIENSSRYF